VRAGTDSASNNNRHNSARIVRHATSLSKFLWLWLRVRRSRRSEDTSARTLAYGSEAEMAHRYHIYHHHYACYYRHVSNKGNVSGVHVDRDWQGNDDPRQAR